MFKVSFPAIAVRLCMAIVYRYIVKVDVTQEVIVRQLSSYRPSVYVHDKIAGTYTECLNKDRDLAD